MHDSLMNLNLLDQDEIRFYKKYGMPTYFSKFYI